MWQSWSQYDSGMTETGAPVPLCRLIAVLFTSKDTAHWSLWTYFPISPSHCYPGLLFPPFNQTSGPASQLPLRRRCSTLTASACLTKVTALLGWGQIPAEALEIVRYCTTIHSLLVHHGEYQNHNILQRIERCSNSIHWLAFLLVAHVKSGLLVENIVLFNKMTVYKIALDYGPLRQRVEMNVARRQLGHLLNISAYWCCRLLTD